MMNWNKSSYPSADACCVWVNIESETVAITYSDPKGGPANTMIRFSYPEWEAFIAGVKDGEFDLK
jgi:predicted secreted Zn-dependent protease